MKEITRIHLARTPFNAEIDAKKALERYIDAIKRALGADDDTMREIEARIVEILSERGVTGEQVITTNDIDAIEAKLGAPDDFVDESDNEVSHVSAPQKRLMRDPQDGLLGGVLAGIADYFGINVLWPRLVAILLVFVSFGTALLVYAVLWIVIPRAKTAADKLQMRGEPVTLASLKSESREEYVEVPERSKPLVILLRVVLGLMFAAMAAGAVAFIGLAIFVREPLFASSLHDFMANGVLSILGGAYIAAIIAGALFVVLMLLATYASFAWVANKKIVTSAIIIVVLGLASFATAVGLGSYGSSQMSQQIEQQKTTETLSNIHLDPATKQLAFTAANQVPVEYRATTGPARVDIQYLRGQKKPVVTVKDGLVKVEGATCTGHWCFGYEKVIIYGPALDAVAVQKGSLAYYMDKQANLAVDVKSDVSVSINGAVDKLALTTPQFCGASGADVGYDSANSVTVNGQQITEGADTGSCLHLN